MVLGQVSNQVDQGERQSAIFGGFDGVVSIIGFVFGLLVHHSSMSAIAIGGLGGAISATVSMATGQFESCEGEWKRRLQSALAMGVATLAGSLMPIWPFFISAFSKTTAVLLAGVGCLLVAGWIGWAKRKGAKGYIIAYVTLLGAAAVTLGIVSLIPASA